VGGVGGDVAAGGDEAKGAKFVPSEGERVSDMDVWNAEGACWEEGEVVEDEGP
jgi:hypothetical protein